MATTLHGPAGPGYLTHPVRCSLAGAGCLLPPAQDQAKFLQAIAKCVPAEV